MISFKILLILNRIPWREKKMLIRAFNYSIYIYLITKVLPLAVILNILKIKVYSIESDDSNYRTIRRNLKRIQRLPWLSNCLVKALTFRYVLLKEGIQSKIIVSVKNNDNSLKEAHAYLEVNNYTFFKKYSFKDVGCLI